MRGLKIYSIGCVVSTRLEMIKMAPVIFQLCMCSWAKVYLICNSMPQRLLKEILDLFNLNTDFDLNFIKFNHSTEQHKETLFIKLDSLIKKQHLDVLLAAGNSTSAFFSSLVAFHQQIPFGHIVTGLQHSNNNFLTRTVNRILTDTLSTWNFVSTNTEKEQLSQEDIQSNKIFITGNTGVDAVQWILKNKPDRNHYGYLQNLIITTVNQYPHFEGNLHNICSAILSLSNNFDDLNFIVTAHANKKVQQELSKFMSNQPHIHLLPLLSYDEFIHLMQRAILILTDSENVQEEASALHKPVLILRSSTEKAEIVAEGLGLLVGTSKKEIIKNVNALLTDGKRYLKLTQCPSPYGDGHAAERIAEILKKSLLHKNKSISTHFNSENH